MVMQLGVDGMRAQGLIVDVRDRVAYATIDRPERLNALSTGLRIALVEAFDRFHRDPEIWAVVLSATGDRAFCAGVDLKEAAAEGALPNEPMRGVAREAFEAVYECGVPTIAALNGLALGGGMELALACDLRVVAQHAQLGMPEVKRGMGGNFGAQMIIRTVPTAVAYEMLYLGESIDAEAALRLGLVNWVVKGEELAATVESLARRLVALAPVTQQRYKAAIQRGRDLPVAAALRLDVRPSPYLSEDRREGIAAFVEGREPRWRGH
jgi:enoyl-CoA hydratase